MKTVMKKMFSLLLVAVLLVGVMPFAAFATEGEQSSETYKVEFQIQVEGEDVETYNFEDSTYKYGFNVQAFLDLYKSGWANSYTIKQVWKDGNKLWEVGGDSNSWNYTTTEQDVDIKLGVVLKPINTHEHNYTVSSTTAATCTTAGSKTYQCECGDSYTETIEATGHSYGDWVETKSATCTEAGEKTRTCSCGATETEAIAATAHNLNSNGKCACGYCDYCKDTRCSSTVDVRFVDTANGDDYTRQYTPGTTVSLSTPDWVSGYDFKGWQVNSQSGYVTSYDIPLSACGSTITFTAKWDQTTTLAKYPVSVYARLKIGDQVQDVDLIHSNKTLLENDKILDYLKHPNTMSLLWSIIEEEYPGYSWSENFHNAYGDTAATDNITVVDGSKSVYINLYAEQDQVLLYVYTDADCEDYEYLYELGGYKHDSVNDTVTASDVRSYLKEKFGSGISIKMFDEAGFEGYWKGKENTSTNYVAVNDGTTKVHVRVYNAYSSSSSKADSSNPKTGDAIFAPMIVLGASASALAVLFYLNKKRAY